MKTRVNSKKQLGQAITEFNVVAAFVLVPLFIMIPLMGKYIDMKHSSVQAARYMAWERTVWFEGSTVPANTSAIPKDKKVLAQEAHDRFFSSVTIDELGGSSKPNPLWNDRGDSLIKNVQVGYYDENGKETSNQDVLSGIPLLIDSDKDLPSPSYQAIEYSSRAVGVVANVGVYVANLFIKAINKVLSLLGIPLSLPLVDNEDLGNKLQFKGYYQATASIALDDKLYQSVFATKADPKPTPALIQSHAAVLTDSWVTEGNEQFAEWTRGLVPFSPLEEPFKLVKAIFTYSPLPGVIPAIAPELGGLELGYVNTDPVKDSSVTLDGKDDCPGGFCSFE